MNNSFTSMALLFAVVAGDAGCRQNLVPTKTGGEQPPDDTSASLAPTSFDVDREVDSLVAYQLKRIDGDKISVPTYLAMTKPYGIWDSRVLTQETVRFQGDVVRSKEFPNYFWGLVGSSRFGLPSAELKRYPEDFLRESFGSLEIHRSVASANQQGLEQLAQAVRRSPHSVFVQQMTLAGSPYERVDELFRRGNTYWRYEHPEGSLLSMTPQWHATEELQFSPADEEVLKGLEKMQLYAAVKVGSVIILLTGGMLDNSRGFVWSETDPDPTQFGHLFHVRVLEPVARGLYFFVSS